MEVQKAGRLADNPKRQSLVGRGLERATMLFLGFQRAEPFGGCGVEKKSGERLPFGEAFICPRFSERKIQGIEWLSSSTMVLKFNNIRKL